MGKQLNFNFKNMSFRKHKNNPSKEYLPRRKEQRSKLQDSDKRQKKQLVSVQLPKRKKEINIKLLSLKESFQEKRISKENFSKTELLFDNLITIEELAVIFRLAPQTIRNWIALGKIPCVQIGRRHFFQKRSLQKWLNQKEIKSWQ